LITDKVHRPAFIQSTGYFCYRYSTCTLLAPFRLLSQVQSFFTIQSIYALVVYFPAFTKQKDMDTTIAVPDPNLCYFSNPLPLFRAW
jgi:hypothetical protein